MIDYNPNLFQKLFLCYQILFGNVRYVREDKYAYKAIYTIEKLD